MELEMPEVPEPLPAPKSLGGLLKHIDNVDDDSEENETGFSSLAERAEELSEDIQERQNIVAALLNEEVDEEITEDEKEV